MLCNAFYAQSKKKKKLQGIFLKKKNTPTYHSNLTVYQGYFKVLKNEDEGKRMFGG